MRGTLNARVDKVERPVGVVGLVHANIAYHFGFAIIGRVGNLDVGWGDALGKAHERDSDVAVLVSGIAFGFVLIAVGAFDLDFGFGLRDLAFLQVRVKPGIDGLAGLGILESDAIG